jgi:hypothetical protein
MANEPNEANPYPAPTPGWSVYELVRFTYPEEDRIEALLGAAITNLCVTRFGGLRCTAQVALAQVQEAFQLAEQRRKGETPCGQVIQLFIGKRVAGPYPGRAVATMALENHGRRVIDSILVLREDTGPLLCEPPAAPPTPEPTFVDPKTHWDEATQTPKDPDPEAEAEYNAGTTD